MSSNSTSTFNTTAPPDVVSQIESAVSDTIWQTLQDLYSGNKGLGYTFLAYILTAIIAFFFLNGIFFVIKHSIRGLSQTENLLFRGRIGADFDPLPVIQDGDDDEEEEDRLDE